jgi:hypothetical protein
MAQGLKKHVLRPKVSSPDSNILGQSPLFSILSSVISSNSPDLSVDICLCMHKHTVPCEFSVIIEKKQGYQECRSIWMHIVHASAPGNDQPVDWMRRVKDWRSVDKAEGSPDPDTDRCLALRDGRPAGAGRELPM